MAAKTMHYRPALDGLRALAVLLVMANHAAVPGFAHWAGQTGVTIFFVISGYLITGLLVARRERLVDFWRRRALRLLPALALVLIVVTPISIARADTHAWTDAVAGVLYIGNWLRATGGTLGNLGHLWSLAIEEQFYLVWPLVLIAARPRVGWLIAAAVAVAVGRLFVTPDMAIFGTFGRADALLAGGALALASWRFPRWAVPAGLALLLAVFALQPDDAAMARYGLTLASLAGILLVGSLADASPARFSPFSHRAPRAIGRVSYGLYLWDYPLVLFLGPVLGSLATFGAAALSYRFVELPFLRLKDRPLHVLPARGASPPFCQQLAVSETQQPISAAPSPISQLLKNNGQRNRLKQVGIGSAEPRTPLSISVTSTSWQVALRRRSSDAPTRFDF